MKFSKELVRSQLLYEKVSCCNTTGYYLIRSSATSSNRESLILTLLFAVLYVFYPLILALLSALLSSPGTGGIASVAGGMSVLKDVVSHRANSFPNYLWFATEKKG